MAKKTAFASMTIGELENALQQNMRELYKSRLESASGQLKTSHVIRLRRREIARIKTALHAKVTPALAKAANQVVADVDPEAIVTKARKVSPKRRVKKVARQ